jgi:hypothetical protein
MVFTKGVIQLLRIEVNCDFWLSQVDRAFAFIECECIKFDKHNSVLNYPEYGNYLLLHLDRLAYFVWRLVHSVMRLMTYRARVL